ncbi:MAG: biopolymer transporter ExbD [Pseudohongiellaceae bacterium]
MKFRRRQREEPAINLTALIDVVFLLLIFFMVTTTFNRETRLAVNLPEADAEAAEAVPDQLEIAVDAEGRYAVNGRLLVDRQPGTLQRALEEVSGNNREVPVVLVADADATHQSVVTAMDVLGQAGFSRLSIATRQNAEDETGDNPGSTASDRE